MTDELQKQDAEIEKAFKVLDDAEAKELGLPTEPTPEDIAEGERARAAMGEAQPVMQSPDAQSPLVAPRPKRWDELPPRVRAELQAGRDALGGGGLSAEQIYNKSIEEVPPPPPVPPDIPEPAPSLTARTLAEQEAGRAALQRRQDEQAYTQQVIANLKAKELADNAPAAPTDLNYTVPR